MSAASILQLRQRGWLRIILIEATSLELQRFGWSIAARGERRERGSALFLEGRAPPAGLRSQ